MMQKQTNIIEVRPSFPALSALGLSSEQVAALAQRGTVCAENRGPEQIHYRLRFRLGAQQHTRYLGKDEGYVDQVREELAKLQAKKQSRRELCRLIKEARQVARRTKRSLEPLLSNTGRAFHGRVIRRRRAQWL